MKVNQYLSLIQDDGLHCIGVDLMALEAYFVLWDEAGDADMD